MRTLEFYVAMFAAAALTCATSASAQSPYGIGRPATAAEVAGWNIDIDRDGHNLPPSSGSASHGHEVFDQQCAACHGTKGEGGVGDRLVGGQGTLATEKPVRTVGSYWPYAPAFVDYIRRAIRHKGRGRRRRSSGGRAGRAGDGKAGADRRQLLAVRPDLVRLYPPRHAAE